MLNFLHCSPYLIFDIGLPYLKIKKTRKIFSEVLVNMTGCLQIIGGE